MDFIEICDRFPRLEYMFGAFCQRYWQTAQTNPKPVIREFGVRNPEIRGETATELIELIKYCTGSQEPWPEDVALDFLEALNCPYYPPYGGYSAIAWFRDVHAVLSRPHDGDSPAIDGEAFLDSPNPIDAPTLPLLPVYVLMFGYDVPLALPVRLEPLTTALLIVKDALIKPSVLRQRTAELAGHVAPISTSIEQLKEVPAWKTLS